MNNWRKIYQHKIVSAATAVKSIKSGDKVALGNACGKPGILLDALADRAPELKNVQLGQMLCIGSAKYAQPGMEKSFRLNSWFVGASTRKAVEERRADYVPCFFSEIPHLFTENIWPVDVALIQVSPPDENGFCSYGISVDYTQPAAECAKIVIAQVNRFMPHTESAKIHLDHIHYIVEGDEPLQELLPPKIGQVQKAIGKNVARLIPDGATLQLGIGSIPDAVLLSLTDKKDLGIHSEMFSNGVVELAEAGVITNRRKKLNPGKFVATFLMGTKRLYDFVHHNPDVDLRSVDYVNNPFIIGQHENMICINSALQVDLMGQINAEMIGMEQFSGVGGQVDFMRGASLSPGGKSIIAIPSTAAQGKVSRIAFDLDDGAAVTTTRNEVQYVVTEYGVADLRGKSIRERALALIAISHPDFRADLQAQAEKRFL